MNSTLMMDYSFFFKVQNIDFYIKKDFDTRVERDHEQ